MHIDIVTIFPEMCEPILGTSILKRALEKECVCIQVHNLRDWTHDKHASVDDRPYGGGPGMVMKPEPFFEAVEALRARQPDQKTTVVLLTPQGEPLKQSRLQAFAQAEHLILLCGHYEGVDDRVRQELVDVEISIGDYVLTCGELPAMVLVDGVVRLLPGVLGHEASTEEESFSQNLLEYPQYTRPPEYRGMRVPDILLSGHFAEIAKWRQAQSVQRTQERRPDLIDE